MHSVSSCYIRSVNGVSSEGPSVRPETLKDLATEFSTQTKKESPGFLKTYHRELIMGRNMGTPPSSRFASSSFGMHRPTFSNDPIYDSASRSLIADQLWRGERAYSDYPQLCGSMRPSFSSSRYCTIRPEFERELALQHLVHKMQRSPDFWWRFYGMMDQYSGGHSASPGRHLYQAQQGLRGGQVQEVGWRSDPSWQRQMVVVY